MKNRAVHVPRRIQKPRALKKRTVGKPDGTTSATEEVANILGRAPAATVPARRIPAKWRWHHRVLLALQSRLMRERRELLRASAQPTEPHSMDEADSATDEFDHDLALTQLSAEQGALYLVNEALQRIVEGTYGICEETGQAIPTARLRAVPWTRFTREVEERLEKMDVVSRARLNKAASVRGNEQIMLAPEGESSEEAAEQAPAPPNDESLSQVISRPGRRVPIRKIQMISHNPTKP